MKKIMINAMLISCRDDVATVTTELRQGDVAVFQKVGEVIHLPVIEDVPKFHKVAVRNIEKQETVRKYGEIIGQATQNIVQGSHVHDHNISSPVNER